jgi:hypothetical protein
MQHRSIQGASRLFKLEGDPILTMHVFHLSSAYDRYVIWIRPKEWLRVMDLQIRYPELKIYKFLNQKIKFNAYKTMPFNALISSIFLMSYAFQNAFPFHILAISRLWSAGKSGANLET